jgi:hypothetical protein
MQAESLHDDVLNIMSAEVAGIRSPDEAKRNPGFAKRNNGSQNKPRRTCHDPALQSGISADAGYRHRVAWMPLRDIPDSGLRPHPGYSTSDA